MSSISYIGASIVRRYFFKIVFDTIFIYRERESESERERERERERDTDRQTDRDIVGERERVRDVCMYVCMYVCIINRHKTPQNVCQIDLYRFKEAICK